MLFRSIAPGTKPWTQPKSLILPTLTLIIAVTPYVARIMRASMIEVLESDYVEMARLKGLPERIVIRRHARRRSSTIGRRDQRRARGIRTGTAAVESLTRWTSSAGG